MILTLFSYKLLYPDYFFMARGRYIYTNVNFSYVERKGHLMSYHIVSCRVMSSHFVSFSCCIMRYRFKLVVIDAAERNEITY